MKQSRILNWFLIFFMLAGIFSGTQLAFPDTANASTDVFPSEGIDTESAPDSTTSDAVVLQLPPVNMELTESTSPSWEPRIFGSGVSAAYNRIAVEGDNVIIDTTGGAGTNGKISSNADGIAYYYCRLPANTPFQLSAKVMVNTFVAGNNQVAFGLMLRKTVGENGSTAGHMSNFAAIGACNQKIQMFSRRNGESKLTNVDLIPSIPLAGNVYELRIIGTDDNKCIVSCGTQTTIIDNTQDLVGEGFYIGLFAARNAKVTFSDINLVTTASSLAITTPPAKTEYLLGESLDLTGLQVTATYEDSSTQVLNPKDYTIMGFDNAFVGIQEITVNYAGRRTSFYINVTKLVCTSMNLVYTPAKTTYYLGDEFEPLGMVINGTFSSGLVRPLTPDEYTISGFDSSTPGKNTITLTLKENVSMTASFEVTIRASVLQSLEITRLPAKSVYYPGEALNLSGMVVSAIYDDSKAMLQAGEYKVDSTGFDTSTSGEKPVIILYKGKTINLVLTVKIRELAGIAVTTLPKTTFYAGEPFDSAGIVVSKIYDSGENELLNASEYTIDSSSFDSNIPGTYNISVVPTDQTLAATSYQVTVRPRTDYVWNTVIFGQSVSTRNNYVTATEPGTVNGTITLTALEGGGKVTGAHDGISFYYTEIDGGKDNFVLSADIKVLAFAKPTPDNQEAFGLMVRDAIGSYTTGTQPVFSSNIAAVGGYRGLTNAFMRTGVINSAGNQGTVMTASSWNTPRPMPENTVPNAPYRLTLEKTNTGFKASLNGQPSTSTLFYSPDDFNCQDSKLYIGFFAARLATIEVSNVSFSVSDAATDPPRELPPSKPLTPELNVLSLANVSKSDYILSLMSNINGTVTIKQGEEIIASDEAVTANTAFTKDTIIAANSNTSFTITMIPDASQVLTSYNKVIKNFTVTMKTYETPDGNIYVSPDGTAAGNGTLSNPLDIDTAVRYVKEGQTLFMLSGTYNRTSPLTIPMGNDGTPEGIKTIAAYNGEPVILDFGTTSAGFQLGGNYWHINGISVTRAVATGFLVGGSNNVIERCILYANGDTGLQISRFLPTLSRLFWPQDNLILNCEAYDNRDASENNADGFAAKLTCGEGNVFRGCISHNNIDDGWDLYTKAETGPIGAVLIENCIAYNNGILTSGHLGAGDKNGFKLGGEGIAVPHVIRNSIAFGNRAAGFTSNSNPAAQAYDCISYDNAGGNMVFTTFAHLPPQFVIQNSVSYRSVSGPIDSVPDLTLNTTNYFYNGTASVNSSGFALSDANFVSLTPVLPYQRDANGNIILGDFLKLISPGNAALKALTAGDETLLPAFSPDVHKYLVTVKNNVKNIIITPTTASHLYSKVQINSRSVLSGEPYEATLDKGHNFFVITVTAQDGITESTYLLDVYKEHDSRKKDLEKHFKELWDAIDQYWEQING